MTGELKALTGARGIAAWWVVLYHIRLSIAGLPAPVLAVLAKGYLAVDFFFLLSGFVIALAWTDRLRVGGWHAVPGFLARRIARVWPLHAAMLAVAAMLALALAATGRETEAVFPWADLPWQVLLVQDWGLTDRLSWNVPAWSISAELAAYLAFPVLALAIDWRRLPSAVVIGAALALLGVLAAAMIGAGAPTLGWRLEQYGVLRCLAEFGAGTALCAIWQRWRAHPRLVAPAALALTTLCFAGWGFGLPEPLAIPPAFAALLLALALSAGRPGNPLDARWLHRLGEVSYATYLSHCLLFFVFKLLLVRDAHAIPPALIALYLGLVALSSVVLHHCVERPGQRWLSAVLTGRATRRVSPPPAPRAARG